MSAIDTLIKINISAQTSAVPQESFGIPLIVGPTQAWTGDFVRAYTDASSMLTDGYELTDPEYIYASKLMDQSRQPVIFYVGRRTGAIAADLAEIQAQNNDWYGVILCSNTDVDILGAAAWCETAKKVFFAASPNADVATSVSTDVLSQLKALGYDRTVLTWSPASAALGIEAAWVGGQLPAVPGSNNWAYKSLVGIAADKISDSQRSIIIGTPIAQLAGKNGNVYSVVGGKAITQMGVAVSGKFIDITIGLDWLESTLQANIYDALSSADKIPYTDKGTGVLISAVKAAIDEGVTNGLIDGASAITITAASVLTVPKSQRANRVAPTIYFGCRLQGAFNAVDIEGTVTV